MTAATRYELRGDVAVITFDRPDVFNSVNQELADSTVAAIARAGEEARVLVLTGAGKAFCAGADLSDLSAEYEAGGPELEEVIARRFDPVVKAIAGAKVPTLAAVNGAAAGAGMGFALGCDLRVLATNAYFMSAFINVGLIPDSGSSWLLPQTVGLSRAIEIAFTGRRVGAEEARELGLAHRLVEPESLLEESLAWAQELADGPTEAYVETRRLLREASSSGMEAAVSAEASEQGRLGRRPAHLEGMRAFLEKRKPDFR